MKEKILNKLESLPFFTREALSVFEDIKSNSLNQNTKRWVHNGLLIRLKKNLYVTKTFVDRSMKDVGYIELLANKLLSPSYLSAEYVLQKHGLLTEGTFSITSVTPKSTRAFDNPLGNFQYRTLNKNLYFGFTEKHFGKNIYYEADPAKALFDFLYFRLSMLDSANPSTIHELRINWKEISRANFKEFSQIMKKSGIKKMELILKLVTTSDFYGKFNR